MQKFNMKPISAMILIASLTGCAATREANHNINTGAKDALDRFSTARAVKANNDPNAAPLANFGHVSQNWVNPKPLVINQDAEMRAHLPDFFHQEVSETMPGKVSLVEVLSEIQRAQKVNFDIDQDIYNVSGKQATIITGTGTSANNTQAVVPAYVNDFVFRGSLESALDLLAAKANVSWRWTGNSIKIFRYEVKTYNISALAGDTTATSQVSLESDSSKDQAQTATAGTSTGSSTSGTAQATASTSTTQGVTRTATLKNWDDIKGYLLSMLSPEGSLAIMQSAGMITVKDTPAVQEQVAKAISVLNKNLSQQIYILVNVYAVTLDNGDNYGIDWNLAWATAGSGVSLGYTNTSGAAGNAFTAGVTSGPFSGSKVVLQALSTIGNASIVNQYNITTLNGQPTPLGNNRKIGYVQSVSVTTDSNGNAATSITAGSVFQGIGMSVTPKIQPNGKILLEYALNLSDVEGITSFTTGGNTIQLPTTTLKNILQRASLRSGQTLILSGFKQTNSTLKKNGVGTANNPLLGGESVSTNENQYLVITVTPYVQQDNSDN